MPILAGILLAAAAGQTLPSPGTAAPVKYPFRTASFLSTITEENAAPVSMRVWISPEGVLEETQRPDGVGHSLRTRGETFVWVEQTGRGMRSRDYGTPRLSGIPDAVDVLRELPLDIGPDSAGRARRETLAGLRVRRYDFHRTDARLKTAREGSVWLLEGRDFPVKFVGRGAGGNFEIANGELRFDAEIPPAYFAVPRDIQFKDMQIHSGAMPPH